MSNLVVAPVVLPLLTGAVLLFAPRRLAWQRGVSIVSALLVVAVGLILVRTAWQGGIQVFQAGNWPAPVGITLVADLTSALLVSATSVAALAVVLFSPYGMGKDREELYYYAGFHFLLVGVHGSFLTGDIFNLFVFFELMLLASYLLVALGGTAVQLRETFKYALINNVASGFFLLGVAWLYRTYGTLNMADLALRVSMSESNGWLSVIAVLFIVVFGVKAAVFPLYGWLPGSYFAGPTPVVAFFGGVLSKVGIYALLRTFTLIFVEDPAFTHRGVLLPLALITMVIGIIGAIAQTDFKRILSFHIISQIGYMLMGIGLLPLGDRRHYHFRGAPDGGEDSAFPHGGRGGAGDGNDRPKEDERPSDEPRTIGSPVSHRGPGARRHPTAVGLFRQTDTAASRRGGTGLLQRGRGLDRGTRDALFHDQDFPLQLLGGREGAASAR